jgi:ABC-type polysaccharide/polyol phosphate export permease
VTARYKRSFLGVLWTLLDPLFTMAVMAVVFSAIFSRTVPAFPVFLLSGLVGWNFMSQASTQAIGDLVFGGPLLGKVYLPRSVFAVAAVGTGLVNVALSLGPLLALIAIFGLPVTPAMAFVPLALLIQSGFALGLGLFFSALAVFYADIMNVHSILLRLLMYLSGIFYTLDILPPNVQGIINANPLYHLVALLRDPLYAGRLPSAWTIGYSVLASVTALGIGFAVFRKLSDDFTYRV